MTSLDYREIYGISLEKFKNKIKPEYIDTLFIERENKKKPDLKQVHLKIPQDPEPLTVDIIRDLLRECGIDPLDITREYIIEGRSNNVFKKVKKKPDFYIQSKDPDINGLLFEIEHLNKDLVKVGDGEGIEQAREWYSVKPALFNHYDSIITNFVEWYFLKCNKEEEDFDPPKKMEPWEVIELIIDRNFGFGREYKTDVDEEKTIEITSKFYSGFQERLKKLLNMPSAISIDIEVQNYKKEADVSQEEHESRLIKYYRTIFSRLLLIKILKSWKMIKIDPLNNIFKEDKRHWGDDLHYLFFDVLNSPKNDRPKDLPAFFRELDYLNGGLFRPSGIELDEHDHRRKVKLNADAIKDIWDFFKTYNFLHKVSNGDENSNTINPEILGYIFERSIGDERKLTGSYYTREGITNYMVENALYSYIMDKINKILSKKKIFPIKKFSDIDFLENSEEIYHYILKNILLEIKICDPACGSGAFLEKSAEKLLILFKKCYKGCGRSLPYLIDNIEKQDSQMPFSDIYSIKKHIIQNNLYGVDINPSAIEICELRLWLWVVKPPEGMMYTSEKITLLPLPNIEYNLRCGNSLIGYQKIRFETNKRIDEASFAEILAKKKDLINSYYFKENSLKENEKEDERKEINKIIEGLKEKLNNSLLTDFKTQNIIIPAKKIELSNYIKDINLRKILRTEISELNRNYKLARIKINFITPVDSKEKKTSGLLYTKDRKTGKIKNIYTSSKFKFQYYSEHRDHPLSKFIFGLISDLKNVQSIELDKWIDLDDLKKVNPFHWFMEYSNVAGEDISEFKGFDIIIGNPPFIRVENIEEPLKLLLKKNYQLAEKRFDIYLLFYELSKNILSNGGYLSLVSSNKFIKSQTAQNMRNYIVDNFSIREILNFNNYNAFQGANINTLLILLKKTKNRTIFPYISINDTSFQLSASTMEIIKNSKEIEKNNEDFSVYVVDEQDLNKKNWEFYPEMVKRIITKLEPPNSVKLLELIKSNRQGVVTSANDVFIVPKSVIDSYEIEPEFVHKIVKGEEIRRWQKIQWDDKYLIYPYRYNIDLDKREKIDIVKDANLNLVKYLEKHKVKLVDRYCVNSGNKEWYELHDPVSPSYFLEKKLMFPDISLVPSFSIDLTGDLFSLDSNYSIIPKNEEWLFYLLAILNSFILEIYIRFKFQTLSEKFRFKNFLVNDIPILSPENVKPAIFNRILSLSKQLFEGYSIELEKELNNVLKDLYDLKTEEYEYVLKIINTHHKLKIKEINN